MTFKSWLQDGYSTHKHQAFAQGRKMKKGTGKTGLRDAESALFH